MRNPPSQFLKNATSNKQGFPVQNMFLSHRKNVLREQFCRYVIAH